MSFKSNKRRAELLGEPFGTASGKLRKAILFELLVETNKNICFQCEERINKIEDLSIEHRIPWMNSKNPIELFYDLGNIAFSHLKCNSSAGEKRVPHPAQQGENNYWSKLTQKQVNEIREEQNSDVPLKELAKKYGVTKDHIWKIKNNRMWKNAKEC